MSRLDHVSMEQLHELLDETEGNKPTQRVLAAIGRKQGSKLDNLAERHDVSEKTVRNWLDRFATGPLSAAPYDEDRSGRPPKLTSEEKAALIDTLQEPPTAAGYDRTGWTPELVQQYIAETYGVEYSLRHVFRLMGAAD